jgi:hypothetical protein
VKIVDKTPLAQLEVARSVGWFDEYAEEQMLR